VGFFHLHIVQRCLPLLADASGRLAVRHTPGQMSAIKSAGGCTFAQLEQHDSWRQKWCAGVAAPPLVASGAALKSPPLPMTDLLRVQSYELSLCFEAPRVAPLANTPPLRVAESLGIRRPRAWQNGPPNLAPRQGVCIDRRRCHLPRQSEATLEICIIDSSSSDSHAVKGPFSTRQRACSIAASQPTDPKQIMHCL